MAKAGRTKRSAVEWQGGLLWVPDFEDAAGEISGAEVLVWVNEEALIMGQFLGSPGMVVGKACESLLDAIRKPLIGPPHAPARVRVASPELAAALQKGQSEIEIVCGPTPIVDVVLNIMEQRIDSDIPDGMSYLTAGVQPDLVARVFRAIAVLYRAKPWKTIPSEKSLIGVSIPKFGLDNAALSIPGQGKKSLLEPGLILFSDEFAFDGFCKAIDDLGMGKEPHVPSHVGVTFETVEDLVPSLREEISKHQWDVAGLNAYPLMLVVDEDTSSGKTPSPQEFAIIEALALALPAVLKEAKSLLKAWIGGESFERKIVVQGYEGEVEVSFQVPYVQDMRGYEPTGNLITDLRLLDRTYRTINEDLREPLERELLQKFEASVEGKAVKESWACGHLMHYGASYCDATIASFGPEVLNEILFDLIPRKVMLKRADAGPIIEQCRAFYQFLKREYGLEQADACLDLLGRQAVKTLEKALVDPSKFGMGKALLMSGQNAGYDIESEEGLAAWLSTSQSEPLPDLFPLPEHWDRELLENKPPARKKKSAKKSTKKARKKKQ